MSEWSAPLRVKKIEGKVHGWWTIICDRCSKRFEMEVSGEDNRRHDLQDLTNLMDNGQEKSDYFSYFGARKKPSGYCNKCVNAIERLCD